MVVNAMCSGPMLCYFNTSDVQKTFLAHLPMVKPLRTVFAGHGDDASSGLLRVAWLWISTKASSEYSFMTSVRQRTGLQSCDSGKHVFQLRLSATPSDHAFRPRIRATPSGHVFQPRLPAMSSDVPFGSRIMQLGRTGCTTDTRLCAQTSSKAETWQLKIGRTEQHRLRCIPQDFLAR